ncbi:MAG: hypothetical protein RLY86_3075 [Pseudomonadota bacterium]
MEMPDFRSPRSHQYAQYYLSLLGPGRLPQRSAFDVTSQRRIIDSFVILEREAPGLVRFRLAGTLERRRYGFEVTGRNYLDFVPEDRREGAEAAFRHMAEHPCGMHAMIVSRTLYGRTTMNEALGFPFRADHSGAIHLIFQSNDLEFDERRQLEGDPLSLHQQVSSRRYIDIGFGVPDPT